MFASRSILSLLLPVLLPVLLQLLLPLYLTPSSDLSSPQSTHLSAGSNPFTQIDFRYHHHRHPHHPHTINTIMTNNNDSEERSVERRNNEVWGRVGRGGGGRVWGWRCVCG